MNLNDLVKHEIKRERERRFGLVCFGWFLGICRVDLVGLSYNHIGGIMDQIHAIYLGLSDTQGIDVYALKKIIRTQNENSL